MQPAPLIGKEEKHPWLMKSPAKLASNCNKGARSLFCWALLPFPHLEALFFNFQVKILNLIQTKRLPNPVLLLFPHSCFDLAGPSFEEKPRKKYVPNLGINQSTLFLGHVDQLSHHRNGNPVNIISSWTQFFVELSNQGQIWSKKQGNQILDTNVSPGPPSAPG